MKLQKNPEIKKEKNKLSSLLDSLLKTIGLDLRQILSPFTPKNFIKNPYDNYPVNKFKITKK